MRRLGAAAGEGNVGIWGGANILTQYLKAGLLDEMQIHLILAAFGVSFLIAKTFYKFGSFGLELVAFLATWAVSMRPLRRLLQLERSRS